MSGEREGGVSLAEIYSQDCEFYRHQDSLMWGRFQTAALVEAGLLTALNLSSSSGLKADQGLLLFAGVVLVLALSLLSLKDHLDARRHLERLRTFEGVRLPDSKWRHYPPGKLFMVLAILILNGVNLILCYRHL